MAQRLRAGVLVLCGALALGAAPPRRSIAVLGVGGGAGYDAKTIELVEELFVSALDASGRFRAISRGDVAALLGHEKLKMALGCEEDAACFAELAGALGADLLAVPMLARLGTTGVMTLKLIEVKSASVAARAQTTVRDDASLPAGIRLLVDQVAATMAAREAGPARGPGAAFWATLGAAAAAGAGGAFGYGAYSAGLRASTAPDARALAAAKSDASWRSTAANVSYGVAGAAALAGGVLWWLGRGSGAPGDAPGSLR